MIDLLFIIKNLKQRPGLYTSPSHNFDSVTAYVSGMLFIYAEYLREKDTRYHLADFLNREMKEWYEPETELSLKELVKQKNPTLDDEQLIFTYIDLVVDFFETDGAVYLKQ